MSPRSVSELRMLSHVLENFGHCPADLNQTTHKPAEINAAGSQRSPLIYFLLKTLLLSVVDDVSSEVKPADWCGIHLGAGQCALAAAAGNQ